MSKSSSVNWETLHQQLSQLFSSEHIQYRAGVVSRDKKRAQALPYAEPRVYEDRLNQVCPEAWNVSFAPWGERIICSLTIHNLTRSSTGESDQAGTSAEAQAFKRACSKFGLGRFLYSMDAPWVRYDEDKRRLAEQPRPVLPGLRTKPTTDSSPSEKEQEAAKDRPADDELLSKHRAHLLHKELGSLPNILSREHTELASHVTQHPIESFTELCEKEARQLLAYARKVNEEREEEIPKRPPKRQKRRAAQEVRA